MHTVTVGTQRDKIPVYDKSLFHGRGDRCGYRTVQKPFDHVIVEGVVFRFQPLSHPPTEMQVLNRHVIEQHAKVNSLVEAYLALEAPPSYAYNWRKSPSKRRRMRRPSMTPMKSNDLSTTAWLPTLCIQNPTTLPIFCPARPIRLIFAKHISASSWKGLLSRCASNYAWSKRQYAPMYIHTPEFEDLRHQLNTLGQITSSHSTASLKHLQTKQWISIPIMKAWVLLNTNPILPLSTVISYPSISTSHTMGASTYIGWPLLSWFHHKVIVWFGIYGPRIDCSTVCAFLCFGCVLRFTQAR